MGRIRNILGCAALFSAFAGAQVASSITLTPSQNPSNFGQSVTLTANVTAGATGKVTFYDGTAVLGISTLAAGQATFATVLLPSGTRYLRAHYPGDSTYGPSNSAVLVQSVAAQPSLALKPGVNTHLSSPANRFAIGDFNTDGKPDLIAATFGGGRILLGNGDGTFQLKPGSLGASPASIIVCDFNGDGKSDVAFTDNLFTSYSLDVALGNGDGTFTLPATLSISPALNIPVVAAGDFNGDGIADLVVSLGNKVGILLGNGNGTFQGIVTYTASNAYTVALGDFNGDGITDLVTGGQNAQSFQILLGNGDGTFQGAVSHALPSTLGSGSVVVADFNGDGKADLAMTDGEFNIIVLIGNGDGNFQAPLLYADTGVGTLAVGDIDGDGHPDLIATNTASGGGSAGMLAILSGNGDGTFQLPLTYAPGPGTALGVGDFNGDSKTDVAVSPYTILLGGAGPDLSVSLGHGPGFTQGQAGAAYTIAVSNVGQYVTSGVVNVTDTLPAGFTATAIGGGGWSCALTTLTCSRSDALAGGASYPGITIAANISSSLTGNATDSATVAGGGDQNPANNTASSTVAIKPTVSVSLTSSPNPSVLGQPVTLTATLSPATAGEVTFYDGGAPLGSAAVARGQAVLTTLLPPGARSLTAEYNPGPTYGASFSPAHVQTVSPVSDNGLQSVASYPVGSTPFYLAVGDFNRDGKLDLVTSNAGSASGSTITILLGNGDGTFRAAASSQTASGPNAVVVADFNRDGKLDLALAGNSALYIQLGNGDGTFQAPVSYGQAGVTGLALSDVNADGIPDLVGATGSGIGVFLGNGDGTFQSAIIAPTTGIVGYVYWTIVDLNGDGNPDLAAVSGSGAGPVNVYLGNGDGTFAQPFSMPGLPIQTPMAITAGDLNGDGKQDIALLYGVGAGVLLGNGDGTFQSPILTAFSGGNNATPGYSAITGDFNGDGKLDIGYRGYANNFVTLALGNGSGGFQTEVTLSTDGNTGNLVFADFNADGKPDFAVLNNSTSTVNVFLGGQLTGINITSIHTGYFLAGQTGATYRLTVTNLGFTSTSGNVIVADTLPPGLSGSAISGSGWTCVVATLTCTRSDALAAGGIYPSITVTVNVSAGLAGGTVNNHASVTSNLGSGSATDATLILTPSVLSLAVTPSSSSLSQSVTLTATITAAATGSILFLDDMNPVGIGAISAGQARFMTTLLPAGVHKLRAVYGGDSTHAGSNAVSAGLTVKAAPDSGLSSPSIDPTGASPAGIAIGDFNGDGKPDLAIANGGANTVSVLIGNGDGTFRTHVDYTVGTQPVSVAIGDFNGDGRTDLAVANQSSNTFSTLLGNGDGTFQNATNYSAGNGPSSIAAGDFNGDGLEDLAVVNATDTTLSVFFGTGNGTFQPGVVGTAAPGLTTAVVADLNSDSFADLVAAGDGIDIFLGNGDGTFTFSTLGGVPGEGFAVGDLNGDGKTDIVYVGNPNSPIVVQLGKGDGTFYNPPQSYLASFAPTALAIADINGDGYPDVIGVSTTRTSLTVSLGNGDGTLQSGMLYTIGAPSTGLVVGDFNSDGRTDVAVSNPSANTARVLLGAGNGPPTMSLNQTVLNFGWSGGSVTDPQSVTVSFSGSPLLPWTASSNQSNVQVSPPSGTGLGTFQVTAAAGPSAIITVTAPGAPNSPLTIQVNIAAVTPGNPFGSFDTPLNGATGVAGSIAVTGWALDSIEVTGVDIWREPVAGEPVSPPLIFIGNATFVAGARPDVQTANPTYPFNYQAGWGYLLLSNELPNNGGAGGPGNGTYKLHAIAHNKTGGSLDLGTKAITVNNAAATPPFGAIDTPGQGATVSGTVTNFGWALTPPALGCPAASQPCIIPVNGSTIFVYVDGISLGNPVYNLARCDVDQLFPGYANSGSTNCALNGTSPGPVGYFNLDTTQLTNGVHTIAWSVTDNAGKAQGIGSRYFTVEN